MKKFILFFISLLIQSFIHTNAYSQSTYESSFILSGGLSFNQVMIRTDKLIDNHENDNDEKNHDETKTYGYGFNTAITYLNTNWEYGFGSDVVFGNIKDLTFVYKGSTIRGSGHFRVMSLGPLVKYNTNYYPFNRYQFYAGIMPTWSLQTFVFTKSQATGAFNGNSRISFENYGGGLFIGLKETRPNIENHPMYIEIGYNYMHSKKVSIVDASNKKEAITLSESDSKEFSAQYLIVRLGMILF